MRVVAFEWMVRLSQLIFYFFYHVLEMDASIPCSIKKEPPIFVSRKQTSRCKIAKLGSFAGFSDAVDWLFYIMLHIKYSLQMMTPTSQCSLCKGDGQSAQA